MKTRLQLNDDALTKICGGTDDGTEWKTAKKVNENTFELDLSVPAKPTPQKPVWQKATPKDPNTFEINPDTDPIIG